MTPPRRTTLRLVAHCDNRCVFCGQDGLEAEARPDWREMIAAARVEAAELTMIGGEPTLHPELTTVVAAAREAGFTAVGIQTHARHLGNDDLAARLVDAGLTDAHVSVHGAAAAVHDYHTGVDGSFASLRRGLIALRRAGATVVATSVLTRSSFRGLAEVGPWLADHGVAAWAIAVPHVAGRAVEGFDRVIPRLGLALPYALHAAATAEKAGLPVAFVGAPLCALGPFAARAVRAPARAFGPRCEPCPVRDACPGLDPVYLERFGDDEVRPPAEPPRSHPLPAALARMFVGPGPLATRPVPRVHPSPAAARRSLPILGRPAPARAEVRGRGPRRSGDALRGLFPDLFEREPDDEGP